MRRAGFGVLMASMAMASCGRIVTLPKTSNGGLAPSGDLFIRVQTLGALDFVNVNYVVIFNTSGNGQEPYATSFASYTNYSFALLFGGSNLSGATYSLLQVVPTGTAAGFQTLSIPIQTQYVTSFNLISTGTVVNGFTFTFNRQLLNIPNPLASATPSPAPSPSPASSPTPSGTPTLAPGQSSLWNLNFFTVTSSTSPTPGQPIDAISNNGISDTTFLCEVDTTQLFDKVFSKPNPPPVQVANPSAQIMAVEVANTP